MRLVTDQVHPVDRALLSFCDPAGELVFDDAKSMQSLFLWVQFSCELPLA